MNLVKVVIPIYQASLSQQERKSLLYICYMIVVRNIVIL